MLRDFYGFGTNIRLGCGNAAERRVAMSYIDMIKDRARLDKKTIVLPESNDKRTLIAAAKIMEEKIVQKEDFTPKDT